MFFFIFFFHCKLLAVAGTNLQTAVFFLSLSYSMNNSLSGSKKSLNPSSSSSSSYVSSCSMTMSSFLKIFPYLPHIFELVISPGVQSFQLVISQFSACKVFGGFDLSVSIFSLPGSPLKLVNHQYLM